MCQIIKHKCRIISTCHNIAIISRCLVTLCVHFSMNIWFLTLLTSTAHIRPSSGSPDSWGCCLPYRNCHLTEISTPKSGNGYSESSFSQQKFQKRECFLIQCPASNVCAEHEKAPLRRIWRWTLDSVTSLVSEISVVVGLWVPSGHIVMINDHD